jgi:proteasome lid subunit RPN8/RPN11
MDHIRLRNADGRPGRFAVADADLRHAERVAICRGSAIVAWVHSHPGHSSRLSAPDRESLAISRLPWVIVACREDGTAKFAAYGADTSAPITVVIRNRNQIARALPGCPSAAQVTPARPPPSMMSDGTLACRPSKR